MPPPTPDFLRRKKRTASVDLRLKVYLLELITTLVLMKKKFLSGVSLLGKVSSILGYVGGVLPPDTAALVFGISSALKNVGEFLGDLADDGKLNKSYKP